VRGRLRSLVAAIGPGILVAATGVGAGDLATASFTGSHLGVAVLWAVVAGALVKFVLNEGLTRWQLASGTSLLAGAVGHVGRPLLYGFLAYYVGFSFLVAAALMSACGAASHAMLPLFGDPVRDKIFYGILHSLVGVVLVRWGGYWLFEKVMGVCIAVMSVTVVVTGALLLRDPGAALQGLILPTIPRATDGGIEWTVALLGGVGGTVTLLCYGYWIREEGREGMNQLRICRIDLAVGYLVTALFGCSMVIIGSTIQVEGSGVGLLVSLSEKLESELGTFLKWAFLVGAWGAIFSSLLGVWQSIPYLFADLLGLLSGRDREAKVDTASRPYRLYLYGLAVVPMVGLLVGFARMQKAYAIMGAAFLPMLAFVLLRLNGSKVAEEARNRPLTTGVLWATLVFFLVSLWFVLV
jgi:Mn2+/Fe2+ NRAMP family transporter